MGISRNRRARWSEPQKYAIYRCRRRNAHLLGGVGLRHSVSGDSLLGHLWVYQVSALTAKGPFCVVYDQRECSRMRAYLLAMAASQQVAIVADRFIVTLLVADAPHHCTKRSLVPDCHDYLGSRVCVFQA